MDDSHQPGIVPLAMAVSAGLAQNWCTPSKNDLKWPKIKQVTNSILNSIYQYVSTIVLNKAGLT